ncbi:hypothetical protein [Sphingomonas sp.]|uniref:hypothetical protein n=1 Tax=Sphingomonas sp. TaxID=28214 RepID=UPI001EC1DEE9|nr:hypothetical protein [Sphingomonas sp.]MBX3595872.1 hypothetical protein [Sphingomonas sp.]
MISMLVALAAVQGMPMVSTPAAHHRPAARRVVARKHARKHAPRRVALTRLKLCVTGQCSASAPDRYRITSETAPNWSAKMDVVKPTGIPCGVQGAPVCPRDGRKLVSAPID